MLSTTDIYRRLANLANFAGVFPVDALASGDLRVDRFSKVSLVANTDSANLPGMHWIAVWYNGDQAPAEIFDSFALTPPAAVQLWCSKNCSNAWKSSNFCIQDPMSTRCGNYCCLFLTNRPKFTTLDDCISYISRV